MSYRISEQSQIKVKSVYIKKSKTYINYFTVKKSKAKKSNAYTVNQSKRKIKCAKRTLNWKKNQKNELLYLHSYFMSSYVVTHMKIRAN